MSCVTDFVVDLMASLKALLCNHLFRPFIAPGKQNSECPLQFSRHKSKFPSLMTQLSTDIFKFAFR